MAKSVSAQLTQKLVRRAGQKLTGEWVLVGGALLIFLGASHRATQDIDLVPAAADGNPEQLKLFELAEELGLPVEAVNSAAGFFLQKIKGYRESLVLLHQGPSARIFRPSATLYLRLKIARLSESDLADCMAMLQWAAREGGEEVDEVALKKAITAELKKASGQSDPKPRAERLEALLRELALRSKSK